MRYILFLLTLVSGLTFGQDNQQTFKTQILENQYIDKQEVKSEIIKHDLSPLLTTTNNQAVLGFIGSDYQRIRVKLISVIINHDNRSQYLVYGKSMVRGNICEFQGTMQLTNARHYSSSEFPNIKQGVVFGEYIFYENPDQKHVGIFKGYFSIDWYIDEKGVIQYNDLMAGADGFDNNKFVGTWTPYNGTNLKNCNWGDYRIPMSGDLDNGAGEFFPDKKYVPNGWQDYVQAYSGQGNSREAFEREKAEWWK